jgi:sugar O-acyltransferase (sialic acid O-acetyltransferase NeuD family)
MTASDGAAKRPAVIFGIGDFARIASVYLREDSDYEVGAFTVHEKYISEPELNGIPVVPFESLEQSHPPTDVELLVAIGFSRVNKARAEVFSECKQRGYRLLSYVHSGVQRWEETTVGENCFIFEENVIQPFVQIGDDVVLWSGNHIGHDTRLGNHCFVASHAVVSGNVTIGDYSFVGVNATFRDGIAVGESNVIGAGAVVMRDTEDGDILLGPASEPIGRKSWDLKGF